MALIDDWLSEYDVGERHDIAVGADPERAVDLVLAAPVAPDPVVAALLAVRRLPPSGRRVEEYLRSRDFEHLGRTPTEWAAAHDGARLKIALVFEAEAIPGGSRLALDTRVTALDGRGPRGRLSLLAVGRSSALVRRRWLRAAQEAARA